MRTAGRICTIAKADPRIFAVPFSAWSLAKLREHLIAAGEPVAVSVDLG